MKLKALKSFMMPDRKRGMTITRKIDEEFEADEMEEGELIYGMLTSSRATVIDEKFIPKSWRYICVHSFSYAQADASRKSCSAGSEITLDQEQGCRYMAAGFVRPVDDLGWTPKKLLRPTVKENTVKQMFDNVEQPKETWTMKGRD